MALFFYKYLHNKKIYKMSEFTPGTVRDLRYLYENVVHGEQEVLGEDASDAGAGTRRLIGGAIKSNINSVKNIATGAADIAGSEFRGAMGQKTTSTNPLARAGNAMVRGARDVAGASFQGLAGQKTTSNNPLAKVDNAITRGISGAPAAAAGFVKGLVTGQGSDKPASPSTPTNGKPRIASLPPDARQVTQYPQGVSTGVGGGNAGASRSTPTPRPAASVPTSRPSAPSTTAPGSPARALPPNAKATTPAAKPAGSAMDQWAKANPKLAAASAERARIRGTAQTDNPLMKDMKSSLPMNSPSVQAPAVAKLGAGNQSLSQNQNAFKAAPVKPATPAATPSLGQRAAAMTSPGSSQYKATTPSAAVAAAPSSSPAASGSVVPATNAIAAAPKPITPNPSGAPMRKEPLWNSYEYDAYDLVLEYLLDDGHAATIAEAEYIMTELDSEVINQIVETRLDPRGRPASGPMNVYRDPKGKPDQAHLDAIKSYDEKQKKKTPEQRKKELDAYIARQRNK
jgi:hypothetical protein